MDASAYRHTRGQLATARRGGQEYAYFIPPPLPRTLDFPLPLVNALSRAEAQLGRLASLGDLLPNPRLLIVPYMRREAVLSSRIEGTQASLSDVFLDEAGAREVADDTDEVRNYVVALEQGIQRIGQERLSVQALRDLHRILLKGVRGESKSPGEFRTEQNWIGHAGTSIQAATYVPPHPEAMVACLDDFQRFLDEEVPLPPLVQVALLHYQFEAIHPFLDGNGRIGRLMIILFLQERGALPAPLLYLSAYFEKDRATYYEGLRRVSEEGAYTDWLEYFLDGVAAQSEDAVARAKRLVALRERYRRDLIGRSASNSALGMLDNLFANPYTSIPRAAELLGVTYPAAAKAIDQYLVPAGIVEEYPTPTRPKRFRASEVLKILDV